MRSAAPAGPVPPFAVQLTDGGNIVVRSVTPLWRTNISRPGRGPAALGEGTERSPIQSDGRARLRSTSCLSSRHAHQLPLDPRPELLPPSLELDEDEDEARSSRGMICV